MRGTTRRHVPRVTAGETSCSVPVSGDRTTRPLPAGHRAPFSLDRTGRGTFRGHGRGWTDPGTVPGRCRAMRPSLVTPALVVIPSLHARVEGAMRRARAARIDDEVPSRSECDMRTCNVARRLHTTRVAD